MIDYYVGVLFNALSLSNEYPILAYPCSLGILCCSPLKALSRLGVRPLHRYGILLLLPVITINHHFHPSVLLSQYSVINLNMTYLHRVFQRSTLAVNCAKRQIGRSFLPPNAILKHNFSSVHKGQDLLADSLAFGPKTKIILDSYYPQTGIDVHGMLEYTTPPTEEESQKNILLMHGSIIAFPHACFLWRPRKAKEVTLESLAVVVLSKPSVEFLFIGCDTPLPPRELNRIKKDMSKRHIVVEQMDIMNAMGTFNVLNGEDRRIAVALLVADEE
jgi:uncharacterized protein